MDFFFFFEKWIFEAGFAADDDSGVNPGTAHSACGFFEHVHILIPAKLTLISFFNVLPGWEKR